MGLLGYYRSTTKIFHEQRTNSFSYCKQNLTVWPDRCVKSKYTLNMDLYLLHNLLFGGNDIRKLLRNCWTTSQLQFGRSSILPVDLMFGLSRDSLKIDSRLEERSSMVVRWDFLSLQPGDWVLLCFLSERGGPGKLRSYREQKIHVAIGRKGNLPVFEVRPGGRTAQSRVLYLTFYVFFFQGKIMILR